MANEKKMDQVILGLLSHESMTGYEIKKRIDTVLKYFWSASFGSIYPTLSKMEQEQLVSKYETTDNGRSKIVYTITDAGRAHLKEWLAVPVVKDELRYETLLKLFFGAEAGKEITLSHLDRFEQKAAAELPQLQHAVQVLSGLQQEDTHRYYMLTALFGVKMYEAYLEWCKEAKELLSE